MVSKKVVQIGLLVVGGFALAGAFGGGDGGVGGERFGRILGAPTDYKAAEGVEKKAAPIIYAFPADTFAGFPEQKLWEPVLPTPKKVKGAGRVGATYQLPSGTAATQEMVSRTKGESVSPAYDPGTGKLSYATLTAAPVSHGVTMRPKKVTSDPTGWMPGDVI